MPARTKVRNWYNQLSANDRKKVDDAEQQSADAARPLLKSAGLIDDNDSDEDVLETLRMRF